MPDDSWIDLKKDARTGIETLRAHFTGHAYDLHWHDSYLIGFTETGVQQFNCRRQLCTSLAGGSFLLEPGEIHDGNSPLKTGFTYRQLYIPANWLQENLASLFHDLPDNFELNIDKNLMQDKHLTASIASAFNALYQEEIDIVREACLDQMLHRIMTHISLKKRHPPFENTLNEVGSLSGSYIALQTKEYLHANLHQDIRLEELAQIIGCDRFRLNRLFKANFGISPHAYLIQLRLVKARSLLAQGISPINVASDLCFSDQSHLGRWFRRAYRLTPADYYKRCSPSNHTNRTKRPDMTV
ncbi:AraC family ligand binding domain-containing protein [Marinomonas sp. 2405UD68-3]|uniref:AraC family transcriptional regulator n=1 Tax=Marinomonas sp. 2405UD68-3 TaxID=3391835 RepID=UPI0039C9C510